MIAATTINPGRLDRRLTLLSPLETRDAGGGVLTAWVNVATVWAQFLPQSGREIQQAGQLIALGAATFRLRYRAISAAWRVMLGDAVYELIAPPVEVGRREYVDLVARVLDRTTLEIDGVGVQALIVDLAEGDDTKAITYATAFTSAPAGVWCKVLPPDGGYNIDSNPIESTRLATGLTVQLAATIPGAGYRLSIIAVQ